MPPPSPALPAELVEEIFLRLPLDEPASLVRASTASRLWLGILTGARFRRLYRDFHGAPPMLGFIYSCYQDNLPDEEEEDNNFPDFVATANLGVRIPAVEDWRGWHKDCTACDCRHGRVLFAIYKESAIPMPLVVWDPMIGRQRLMYAPVDYDSSAAAVLCSVPGCDHGACHAGPFQVVFVGLWIGDGGCATAYAHVSLPDVGNWSESCPALDLPGEVAYIVDMPPVYIQDALYFILTYEFVGVNNDIAILKYDVGSSSLSLIDGPPVKACRIDHAETVLMAMEDASLGFAHVDGLILRLWSRHIGSNGVMPWSCRVIDLKTLCPIRDLKEQIRPIGSAEYNDIIFVTMDHGIYKINLKSLRSKKIWKKGKCVALFPYMSFYNAPERVDLYHAGALKMNG